MKANEPNNTPGVDDDDIEQAQRGLRQYVAEVATGLGIGVVATWCELADQGSAYLPLDQRIPGRADRDVALVWDERRGWAIGVETNSGEDLLIVAWQGGQPLPPPHAVVRFAERVLSGRGLGATHPPFAGPDQVRAVRARLASYQPAVA